MSEKKDVHKHIIDQNLAAEDHAGSKSRRSRRSWRFWPALWIGKLAVLALRLLGKKGTTFPGVVANRIDPDIIGHLGQGYPDGIVIVTGTNGKTTTANLLAKVLKTAGFKFAFNQAGANLVSGIAGALLEQARWSGSSPARLALLEVDEATVPKVCRQLTPKAAIITNFFRDQLDRYGELDTTIRMVQEALPKETLLIINADDPLVAQFGLNHHMVMYYGVERTPESRTESQETREARFCPVCGATLSYSLFHYGQLGVYHCPECDFARPQAQVLAENVHMEDGDIRFRVGVTSYSLSLEGYYNLYNALAALAVARVLGVNEREIERGLREFEAQAGRMERFNLSQGRVTLTLVKNPTGFNQVLRTVLGSDRDICLMIAINDLAADGRDISWLWDVDFELLGAEEHRIRRIVCSGLRAQDMALRLKYAGVKLEKLMLEPSLEQALMLLQQERQAEDTVFALPTYTALFPLRELLVKQSRDAAGGAERQTLEASA